MEPFIKSYTAAADPSTWANRIVYISANDTVSLHTTPATQIPVGVVKDIYVNSTDYKVNVVIQGPAWVKVGEAGLDADVDVYLTGDDDSAGAAEDGKAAPAVAGDYYVGRARVETNIVEDGLAQVIVSPGQLAQSAG